MFSVSNRKESMVNPAYLLAHSKLKNACSAYRFAEKAYGKGSDEAKQAFERRRAAEACFCNLEGVVACNDNRAVTKNDAIQTVTSYQNEVNSWYA